MSYAWEFSPDNDVTVLDIADIECRDDIDGINLLENKAVTTTLNGVTFTVNADKSVTVNGTATDNCFFKINGDGVKYKAGSYIATSKEGSGSASTYFAFIRNMTDSENTNILTAGDTPITISSEKTLRYSIFVASGVTISNKTFYPMLTEAKYAGIPYRPFNNQAIQHQINAQTGILGVRNFLNVTATTQIDNGVTFTINRDSKGNLVSIVANGTAGTGNSSIKLRPNDIGANIPFPEKQTLRLTGCPKGGTTNTYYLKLRFGNQSTNAFTVQALDTGEGANVYYPGYSNDVNYGQTQYEIIIVEGITVNNIVFKPQIALASDPDDTYVPYAMTNRELTEVKTITVSGTNTTSNATVNSLTAYKNGKIVQFNAVVTTTAEVNIGSSIEFTLSGLPSVSNTAVLTGFNGSTALLAFLGSDTLSIRVIGANLPTNKKITLTGLYISQ